MLCLAAVLALVPLAFAPGMSLYYDVTPKVLTLCCGAAFLAFFALNSIRALSATSSGRRILWLMALAVASLLLSTVWSTSPAASVSGTNWRRFGLVTEVALAIFFLVAVAVLSRSRAAGQALLRVVAVTAVFCCLYGVLQYFELDPFIQRQIYSAGQFGQPILRPPSTLGSGPGFGNYGLMVVFLCLALWREEVGGWRYVAGGVTVLGAIAVIVSGTRAPLLGLAAGIGFLAARRIRSIRPPALIVILTAAGCLIAFYLSPAGQYLRNRATQAVGDWRGGTRTWLWRDSLRMFGRRPLIGYGLDRFGGEFPRFESAGLANAYPDHYNESPHNVLLDTLLAQGILGLASLVGLLALALWNGWRHRNCRGPHEIVFAGLASSLIAHQFFVLEATTAVYLYYGIAFLLADPSAVGPVSRKRETAIERICQAWAAGLLLVFALEMAVADRHFERARQDLDAGRVAASLANYEKARRWAPPGFNSSLWYSRALLATAQRRNEVQVLIPEISRSAWDGYRSAEDRHNACYHLAMLYGSQGEPNRALAILRECVALAPRWYVLYWSAAVTLQSLGDPAHAEQMAVQAVEFSGKHRPEMTQLLNSVRSQTPGPGSRTEPATSPGIPVIAQGGIAEPWTYTKGISPGTWVSIYGFHLAPVTQNWSPLQDSPLPTTLAGVTVLFDGAAAPISYVSPAMVNVLVPAQTGEGRVWVTVASEGVRSAPYPIDSTRYLPAIYCNAAAGGLPARFYVTAVDPLTGDYLGTASVDKRVKRTVRPGDTIDLFAIGLGPTEPPFSTDTLLNKTLRVATDFKVLLGSVSISPAFAAWVGPGLYQVRIQVPLTVSGGDQPVALDFGRARSASGVYLTIQP